MKKLYPVTIITTRYGGVYEGGSWAAFPTHPEKVPEDATDDDVTTSIFWSENSSLIGVGEAPSAAYFNLYSKISIQISKKGLAIVQAELETLYGKWDTIKLSHYFTENGVVK